MCDIDIVFRFFFFKQKTAYEMRISDWSSDVCSSDLQRLVAGVEIGALQLGHGFGVDPARGHEIERLADAVGQRLILLEPRRAAHEIERPGVNLMEIGIDRKSVVWGKMVIGREDLGGLHIYENKK